MKRRTHATRGFHNRMAVIFDFDQTLADGTIDALLTWMGVEDCERWHEERVEPLVKDGWDEILAHAPVLAETARERGVDLTREFLEEVGRQLPAYPGVDETLAALREIGREASGGADVELYVLSCGFVEIMCNSAVAARFDEMWGSAFHWDDRGRLVTVKRAIIHSEKARYLLALAKGLDLAGSDEPEDVHMPKPIEEWYVPLDQMIYVGDGISDIAAFNLMHEHGGIAIAVNQAKDGSWGAAKHIFDGARVDNLAPPDFREGREMSTSLRLAVESIGKKIALRRLAQGE